MSRCCPDTTGSVTYQPWGLAPLRWPQQRLSLRCSSQDPGGPLRAQAKERRAVEQILDIGDVDVVQLDAGWLACAAGHGQLHRAWGLGRGLGSAGEGLLCTAGVSCM